MYEVEVYNTKDNRIFRKVFWSKDRMDKFINKVIHSNKLKLLMIINNSYLYD